MFESGARVGGWTLDWQLGSGAGGEVFRARHDDGRIAAIKLARPGTDARLAREAELLAAIGHDAFPAFVERVDGGYVMELITGRSLEAVAPPGRPRSRCRCSASSPARWPRCTPAGGSTATSPSATCWSRAAAGCA